MARFGRDADRAGLHGNLKQLVSQLSEAELLQLRGWIEREIPRARVRGPRVVRGPSAADLMHFDGTVAELAGAIRRSIHELPEASLIVLGKWIHDQLDIYRHRDLVRRGARLGLVWDSERDSGDGEDG
ncbi:MAG: hypothetical protein R3F59_18250 [Myxococcota bacterium]